MTLDGTFAEGKRRASADRLQAVIALSTWVPLLCYAESILFVFFFFFTAWKLLVLELLPLFLTTEILTRLRWIICSLFSPCALAKLKKKCRTWCPTLALHPALGVPAVLLPHQLGTPVPPRAVVQPPPCPAFGDHPKPAGSEPGPAGMPRSAWGRPWLRESQPCRGRRDSGLHKPRERHRLQKGCFRVRGARLGASRGSLEAQPEDGRAHALWGGCSAYPRHTQPGSGASSIQPSCGSATGCVRLLGWSPMRRVIPKLFLITFSIGGV